MSPRTPRARRFTVAATAAVTLAAAGIVSLALITQATPAGAATGPFDNPGVGAAVPFTEYEAENARVAGTVIGPDYTQGTLASESSGRRAVSLGQGQSVEFTLTAPANAVDVAYNVARGQSGTLSIYVDNSRITPKLAVTSQYSYVDTGWIPGSKTHHLLDDSRVLLGQTVGVGGKVRFQVDAGDIPTTVDVADFENVAAPAAQPAGSLSVATTGADPSGNGDSTNAFNQAITNARNAGQSVWIPPGTFRITSPIQFNAIAVRGAGPWYSVLHGTHLMDNGSTTGAVHLSDFAAIGDVSVRNDGSPDNFVNGSLGNGSSVSNIWIQHQKVGLWLVGPNNANLTIENNRILDTTADGINFNGTVTNSVVRNNFLRNNGDDGLAMWSIHAPDTSDTFANNTVVQPNLANGIAIYGGRDITVTKNVVADTNALGSGIAISNQQFVADNFSPLAGTMTVSDNVLIRTGALNPNWGHAMSAIRVDAYDFAVNATVNISGGKILESPYSAFQIVGGAGTGQAVNNLTVSGVNVSGVGTTVVQSETQGSGTFSGVVASGVGVAGIYNCSFPNGTPNFSISQGAGNSGWQSVWPGCDFPVPGATPTSSTPPPPPPPGSNLALHRPASASGTNAGFPAGNATDGDVNTYWESTNNAFPQWIQVDLGQALSVSRAVFTLPPASAWATRTQTLAIQGSTDGSAFTTLAGSRGVTFDPASGNTATVTFPAATVRFVRVTVSANTGWPAGQFSEVQLYAEGGSTTPPPTTTPPPPPPGNLVSAVSASSFTDVYQPGNAHDGNASTYWESANNAFPQWLQADLGGSRTVTRAVLKLPPATAWNARTQTITIQGSADGSSFTTLAASQGYTFDPATGNTVTVTFPNATVRFVRLTITANTAWPAAQLGEFEVYAQ
jgi:Alpha-1,3-glucanase catalytic domain D1/Alpha-1,3-glucanase catalytic domain D2/F5/8 type C domain